MGLLPLHDTFPVQEKKVVQTGALSPAQLPRGLRQVRETYWARVL